MQNRSYHIIHNRYNLFIQVKAGWSIRTVSAVLAKDSMSGYLTGAGAAERSGQAGENERECLALLAIRIV